MMNFRLVTFGGKTFITSADNGIVKQIKQNEASTQNFVYECTQEALGRLPAHALLLPDWRLTEQ